MFSKVAGADPLDISKRYNHQSWTPPLIEWIKFNKMHREPERII